VAQPPGLHAILIFADGASSGNPGPGGWGAIVARPDGTVTELGGGEPDTTNNRMELLAAIRGLAEVREEPGPVALCTDSTYVIRGITQWIWGWRKRGWKTAEGADVSNQDLWKKLSILADDRKKAGGPVSWRYVRGHSGVPGNDRVDEIAVSFTKGRRASLYHGPLLGYGVAIHDLPEDMELPPLQEKRGPKPAAHSYLSLVNGEARRHRDWPSCEARVKGRPGAKFKKAMSAADEASILGDWGVDRSRLKDD
jgi:ribonuclease HI